MSDEQGEGVTRRQALAVGLVGAATLAAASSMSGDTSQASPGAQRKGSGGQRMPVVFMPHGGGPWPFVDDVRCVVGRSRHAGAEGA